MVVTSVDADKRLHDVTFFRLHCNLNPGSFDPCIGDELFAITFCLCLPQQTYQKGTGIVEGSATKDAVPMPSSTLELFPGAGDNDDGDNNGDNPTFNSPAPFKRTEGVRDIVSPKMNMFLSISKQDRNADGAITHGYYEP